jgi:molybdopterin synthase catalytic subunit
MEPVGLHRKGEVDLDQILDQFSKLARYREAGAVACFLGVVREDPVRESEAKVTHLEYEAYTEVALKKMQAIREGMLRRPGIVDVAIHHVIDSLTVGEPSLFVVVIGKHRQEAFSVLSDTVDRVKHEVPIWKKEFTTKDSYWVSTEEHG